MELLNELMELNPTVTKEHRNSKGLRVGEFFMSIQGSDTHYCSPRKKGLKLDQYYSLEIMLYKDGRIYDVWKCQELKEFTSYNRLMSYGNGANNPLGWVPVDLLNELYLHLKTYLK